MNEDSLLIETFNKIQMPIMTIVAEPFFRGCLESNQQSTAFPSLPTSRQFIPRRSEDVPRNKAIAASREDLHQIYSRWWFDSRSMWRRYR